MTISEIVQRSDTTPGRIFDSTVIVLILVSVITVTIDTLPTLSPGVRTVLSWSEVVIVGLFTIEYGLRVGTAPRKLQYVLSFHGIVDLAAILPFYLTLGGVDLRALRILQLFRIVRILKLSRYSEALARFGKAMALAKEEIVLFAGVAIALLYLSAAGIWYFERTTRSLREHLAQPLVGNGHPHDGGLRRCVPGHRGRQTLHVRYPDVRTGNCRGARWARSRSAVASPPREIRRRATIEVVFGMKIRPSARRHISVHFCTNLARPLFTALNPRRRRWRTAIGPRERWISSGVYGGSARRHEGRGRRSRWSGRRARALWSTPYRRETARACRWAPRPGNLQDSSALHFLRRDRCAVSNPIPTRSAWRFRAHGLSGHCPGRLYVS